MEEHLRKWVNQIDEVDRCITTMAMEGPANIQNMAEITALRKTQVEMKINFVYEYLLTQARR